MSTLMRLGSILAAVAALFFVASPADAAWNVVVHYGAGGQQIGQAVSQSQPAASHTGDTSETILANIRIPANTVGANDRIIIRTFWSFTGTAGTKTTKVYLNTSAAIGGTTYLSAAGSSTDLSGVYETFIDEAGTTASQIGGLASGANGRSSSAQVTSTVDMTADSYIVITGTLGSSADTVTLSGVQVEVLKNN